MKTIRTPHLAFAPHRFSDRNWFCEQVSSDIPMHYEVARPLFDAGIESVAISERAHFHSRREEYPYHHLILLLQGQLHVALNGQAHTLHPGDLMVCLAGTPMETSSGGRTWRIYIDILDTPAWKPIKARGASVQPCRSAAMIFLLLREILDAKSSHLPADVVRALDNSRSLALLLRRELIQDAPAEPQLARALQGLLEEIRQAPAKDWDRPTLAAKLNMSISRMSRLFHKQFNLAPHMLILRQRMNIATHLLADTDLEIKTIAAKLGYDSLHSFTRLFHKHVGLPPGQYRAHHAASALQTPDRPARQA
jgi:AraC-like DNA-binding protein